MTDHDGGTVDPTIVKADATVARTPREEPGQQIGRYKLLQQIGEGGFGTVWMAEQREPVKRRVALKIIKLGMDTKQVIARFEAERQALALMDHPNIAKVLDAGSTDAGRPYFVMEYIKGVPILDYCDNQKVETSARLQLFISVCSAIQHAHQKGIIHRDIKPSNVLVTLHDGDPVTKVIDFGIAKATDTELTQKTLFTEHRQLIGTPAYMSPEQAEMSGLDIDTRSDIYSLGVLLYELLTGTTPFDSESLMQAGFAEMMRIIREEEPHKPSTRLSSLGDTETRTAEQRRTDVGKLRSLLRGDLDWIAMKCLEKDRTRRYETANGLAADIRRHMDDEPIMASPPSAAYRLKKFTRRNRGKVIAGSAFASLLVVGFVGMFILYQWASSERARVVAQADRAAEALRAVTDEFADSIEQAPDVAEVSPGEEVEALAATAVNLVRSLDASKAAEAARAAELEQVSAFQSRQLSSVDARAMGEQLRASILQAAGDERRAALESELGEVNFTSIALGTLEENIFVRSIDAIDTQFETQPHVRASLLQSVAETTMNLGLLTLANDPLDRALQLQRDELGPDHSDVVRSLQLRTQLLAMQGRFDESIMNCQVAIDTCRRVFGDEHTRTILSIGNMGKTLYFQGRLDEAEPYFRESLELERRVRGDDHRNTLSAIANLGALLKMQGKYEEAEPYHIEAIEGRRRVLGDDHLHTLQAIDNLGKLRESQGRYEEATRHTLEAVEGFRHMLGDEHPTTLVGISGLGRLHVQQGEYEEAETLLRECLETRRRVLGEDHLRTAFSKYALGELFVGLDRWAEAEPLLLDAYEVRLAVQGADHTETALAVEYLVKLYDGWHEAEPDGGHDASVAEWRERLPAGE